MSIGAEAVMYKATLVRAQIIEEGRICYLSRLRTHTLTRKFIMSVQELFLVTGANGTQHIPPR
jgi:hypothetical protein